MVKKPFCCIKWFVTTSAPRLDSISLFITTDHIHTGNHIHLFIKARMTKVPAWKTAGTHPPSPLNPLTRNTRLLPSLNVHSRNHHHHRLNNAVWNGFRTVILQLGRDGWDGMEISGAMLRAPMVLISSQSHEHYIILRSAPKYFIQGFWLKISESSPLLPLLS